MKKDWRDMSWFVNTPRFRCVDDQNFGGHFPQPTSKECLHV